MVDRSSPLTRPLLGALLLSIAFHAFLIVNIKPASARYAGSSLSSLNARLTALVRNVPGAGAMAALPAQRSSAEAREPDAATRKSARDGNQTKTFLGGSDARAGNLPDGRSAELELDLPLMNQYYTAREVDKRATPLEEVPLVNPILNLGPGKSAKVILLVLINENGGVDSVATLEARPPGIFDGMARAAFSATRFSPALKGGKPVKSQKIVEVLYGS